MKHFSNSHFLWYLYVYEQGMAWLLIQFAQQYIHNDRLAFGISLIAFISFRSVNEVKNYISYICIFYYVRLWNDFTTEWMLEYEWITSGDNNHASTSRSGHYGYEDKLWMEQFTSVCEIYTIDIHIGDILYVIGSFEMRYDQVIYILLGIYNWRQSNGRWDI